MISPLGLYLHIPFCASICSYCNFTRGLLNEDLKRAYLDALAREIQSDAPLSRERPLDTIYLGGGTPSLLTPEELARVIGAVARRFATADDVEVTVETNPDSVDRAKLAGFREAGVTRISFGVQSFNDAELARLGRTHSSGRAETAYEDARAAGFDNVSLDLMAWLPGQTIANLAASLDRAIALGPDHLSVYLLELYPNAPLRDEMTRGGWELPGDEVAARMYGDTSDRLAAAGYRHYEISNFARPGRESRHNRKYWVDADWLACGCGAHAHVGDARWRNLSSTDAYIAAMETRGEAVAERRTLSPAERATEALITGLRLADGIDLVAFAARYGVDVLAKYGAALAPFLDAGLAVLDGDRLRLTRGGFLLSNEILQAFI